MHKAHCSPNGAARAERGNFSRSVRVVNTWRVPVCIRRLWKLFGSAEMRFPGVARVCLCLAPQSNLAEYASSNSRLLISKYGKHISPNVFGILGCVKSFPDAGLLVVRNDGCGLLMVGSKSFLQRVCIVIGTLDQGLASQVILHGLLGWIEDLVI
jgi:hypothetical protein